MTGKILIKALIRLDRFIEKFQNFLQEARVKIIETIWDLKEKKKFKISFHALHTLGR